MKPTGWSQGLTVTADGSGVVPLAGVAVVRLLADRVGLTAGLSAALTRRRFVPVHDRGQVLVDVATVMVAGGEAIADIETLRHQDLLFGRVASAATVWRALDEITAAALKRIGKVRAQARRQVWAQFREGLPAAPVAGGDLGETVVLDVDATLITAHSEKERAAATFKGGFGFHPLGVWCDNTGEMLAIKLRPGNTNANHAGDHIEMLSEAIDQIPAGHRRTILVRADTAGATRQMIDWLTNLNQRRGRRVEYSIGFPVHKGIAVHGAIQALPQQAWTAALDADGEVRDGAQVAELTGLLDLTKWPVGLRVIVRREKPHPGAGLTLFEQHDGWRYQAFATNSATGQLAFLEARHRAHARVEDRIRVAKDTGLGRLPSREWAINQVWVQITAIAADLTAWLQHLALTGDLAKAEPKTLRFRMLHVPARLIRGGRGRRLRIPAHWPWAAQIAEAFRRTMIIPAPT